MHVALPAVAVCDVVRAAVAADDRGRRRAVVVPRVGGSLYFYPAAVRGGAGRDHAVVEVRAHHVPERDQELLVPSPVGVTVGVVQDAELE